MGNSNTALPYNGDTDQAKSANLAQYSLEVIDVNLWQKMFEKMPQTCIFVLILLFSGR